MSIAVQVIQENELEKVYETIVQLRTHLSQEQFILQAKQQLSQGYILVGIQVNHRYIAVAGYRYSMNLAWGKFLYCDDLVVDMNIRAKGYGDILMKYMYSEAKNNSCNSFQLDSGVQRFGAHRLYIKNSMDISCHHFSRNCSEKSN